ncbi:MAG: ABC transporter ATP-binding protein [Clostridiales bacterium]|nr:ABC transporter ATP-binding protein [Clostridiales bacterium]
MAGTILEVVLPAILAFIVDDIIPTENKNRIIIWGLIMALFSFGAWILNVVANRMASRTSSLTIQNIRQDLFERSMGLSARQIDNISVSSLEARMTSDTYVIHRFLGATLRMGIRSVMLFLGGVLFCFYLSWRLALILVVLVVPLGIVIRYVFSRVIRLFNDVQKKLDDMVQVIRENIRGIRVSKALDKTEYEKERYLESNKAVAQAEIKATDQMAIMSPMVNTILFTGLAAVIILGAYLSNKGLILTGTIMAFLSYFIQITNSLMGLNRMFNIYNRAMASSSRIEEILTMPKDDNQVIEEVLELPKADKNIPEVEFRNVSFSYLGKSNNISNISFKVYPGQTLGIMGPTGSGKSTIIRLLLRQYDVSAGEILIRGINIKKLKRSDINKMFGIVFQNDFIYRATVRENIDFGRNLSDEEINTATIHAQAMEFVGEKEGGLDFELSSKGVNLSGGQKQRLLLSRALAAKPEILILDDSSSALDFKTDAKLRQAIKENFSNTTSFIIAQRVSSVSHAEQILVLESGKMIALGSHKELLESCEPYREIASLQLGDSKEDKKGKEVAYGN